MHRIKVKKDILLVILQFLLFALYFIGWDVFDLTFPVWVDYVSIIFVVTGIIIIAFGVVNLNDDLSFYSKPKKNNSLLLTGIYRYVRNPIYGGMLLSMMAYSFFDASPLKMIIVFLLAVVLYFQTRLEEQVLTTHFSQYKGYIKTTGRFFPRTKHRATK